MFQWIVFQSIWKWPWHHKERKKKIVNKERASSLLPKSATELVVSSVQRVFHSTKRRESYFRVNDGVGGAKGCEYFHKTRIDENK